VLLPDAEHLDLAPVLADFERDGFARLGRVLDDRGLVALQQRATELMLGQVTYPGLFFQLDSATGLYRDAPIGLGWQGPSLDYRKLEKLEKDPIFLQWLENPLFERVARAEIAEEVVLYRAILFNKGKSTGGSDIPFHQDGGTLWGLSQAPHLQIWTALDDAPVCGGCLEVVPGSHRWGLATALGGVVPQDQVLAREAVQRAVPLPARAGEAILVHNVLWHRSGRALPGQRRLGFSVCYMSELTKCLRKKRAPRVFFPVFRQQRSA